MEGPKHIKDGCLSFQIALEINVKGIGVFNEVRRCKLLS